MADDDGGAVVGVALDEAIAALNGAQVRLAGASQHANGAVRRMGTSGFPGIARELAGMKDDIDAVRAAVGAIVPTVRARSGAVATVTGHTTPAQALVTLNPVVAGIEEIVTACDTVGEALSRLEGRIRQRLSGGAPQEMLAKTSPARAALAAARRHLLAAKTATEAALTQARRAGALAVATAINPDSPVTEVGQTTAIIGDTVQSPSDMAGSATIAGLDGDDDSPSNRLRRKRPRLSKFVDEAAKSGDEVTDVAKVCAEDVSNILSPPAGHAVIEVSAEPPPSPHVSAPDLASSIAAVGVLTAKAVMMSMQHWLNRRKGSS